MFNGIILADENKTIYRDLSWDLYDSAMTGVVAAVRQQEIMQEIQQG